MGLFQGPDAGQISEARRVYTDMEWWTEIRRRVRAKGVSKRQVLRETGIHWKTLERIILGDKKDSNTCSHMTPEPPANRKRPGLSLLYIVERFPHHPMVRKILLSGPGSRTRDVCRNPPYGCCFMMRPGADIDSANPFSDPPGGYRMIS